MFPRYFRTLLKNIFLGACFVEVGFSGRQTFNIREKAAAIQRALFEHLFLCDHYQDRVCSVVFIKQSSNTYVFLDVFQIFSAAISECSHEKIYFFTVFLLKSNFTRNNLLRFLEMILCPKSFQWISILVASNNISRNRTDHRRYPSVHFDKY